MASLNWLWLRSVMMAFSYLSPWSTRPHTSKVSQPMRSASRSTTTSLINWSQRWFQPKICAVWLWKNSMLCLNNSDIGFKSIRPTRRSKSSESNGKLLKALSRCIRIDLPSNYQCGLTLSISKINCMLWGQIEPCMIREWFACIDQRRFTISACKSWQSSVVRHRLGMALSSTTKALNSFYSSQSWTSIPSWLSLP